MLLRRSDIEDAFSRFTGYRFTGGLVSSASLASIRVVIGLLVSYGAVRFMLEGWIDTLLLEPTHFFSYYGFEWLPRPNGIVAYGLYGLLAAGGLSIAAGYRYRLATSLVLAVFTYTQLLDATNYLNHYYLVVLLLMLLCLIPTHTRYSLDVLQGRVRARKLVPSWYLLAFLLQIAVVYVFAGIAKINSDWLVDAMPMAVWLPSYSHWPVVGGLMALPLTAKLASWVGMLYDCTIVGWLLYGRTRRWAYGAVLLFHGATAMMFNIGLFPLIMTGLTLAFFAPVAHERFWRKLTGLWTSLAKGQRHSRANSCMRLTPKPVTVAVLTCFFAVQLLLPLRIMLYPGDTKWTEEGYRFGWRVMLVEKAGQAQFAAASADGCEKELVDLDAYLTPYQQKQMAIQPEFIAQFARIIAKDYSERYGWDSPVVTADVWVALNGRRSKQLIDPETNLASVSLGLSPKPWIKHYQ